LASRIQGLAFEFSDRDSLANVFAKEPWEHQIRGVLQVIIDSAKHRAITLCAPTGSGKSIMMSAIIECACQVGLKSVVYTNRRLLTKQTMDNLSSHGFQYGVRAASQKDLYDPTKPIQLSSLPTEIQRVLKQKSWSLYDADLVFVDESHLQATGLNEDILRLHLAMGATIIGVTATPIEVSHLYPHLVVCATNSELRACGAHVPAIVKAPFEMDLDKVSKVKTGEFNIGDIRKNVWCQQIVGGVVKHWEELNPTKRPTLVFAPGVPESISLAREFENNGHKSASIDASKIYIDGHQYRDTPDGAIRDEVIGMWRSGQIDIICNRFVMREAFDFPGLYHEILAAPMGTLKGYLQSVGRVIRKSPETPDRVLISDHAANIYRHGSPNEDRDWHSMYHMSDREIVEARKKKLQEDPKSDPITCPQCGTIRKANVPQCPPPPIGCGQDSLKSIRRVMQTNGTLRECLGPIVRPEKPKKVQSPDQARWTNVYYQFRNSGRTFKQAIAYFEREYGHRPSMELNLMPMYELTMNRKVKDVPYRELRSDLDKKPPNVENA
jgi:DNA repair protein RadD